MNPDKPQHAADEAAGTMAGRTSAMIDGELPATQAQAWLDAWASDEDARRRWHAYHLIGDVMRSDDLAADPAHDRRQLDRLRAALRAEPVVLAPQATKAAPAAPESARRGPRLRHRLWAGSAAAAAGFMLVGGAYVVTRLDPDITVLQMASVPSAIQPSASVLPWSSSPSDDVRRASVGPIEGRMPSTGVPMVPPWALRSPIAEFREILRLPRGPAARPQEAVQVLYSNGSATISVQIEPFKADQHAPKAEVGERLNALSLQRHGAWLTLTGDVPLSTLSQFAAALQPVNPASSNPP